MTRLACCRSQRLQVKKSQKAKIESGFFLICRILSEPWTVLFVNSLFVVALRRSLCI